MKNKRNKLVLNLTDNQKAILINAVKAYKAQEHSKAYEAKNDLLSQIRDSSISQLFSYGNEIPSFDVVSFSAILNKKDVRLTVFKDDLSIVSRDNVNEYQKNNNNFNALDCISFEMLYHS